MSAPPKHQGARATFYFPNQQPHAFPMVMVDQWLQYGIRICINYSSQIGGTAILLAVLLLVTKPEKRRSPIFVLNVLSLATDAIRNILQCLYFTGQFYSAASFFGGILPSNPAGPSAISIAGVVLTFLLVVWIETSLVLQVRAVSVTMRSKHRVILLAISTAVALVAVAFRFALMVENSMAVKELRPFTAMWLAAASNYSTAASICFFSLTFVTKLGVALHQRRKMGLKQFGPMQVIFIMGCQTMTIPALFSLLENFTSVPELGSQVLTTVAIFLPLSSMWAAASLKSKPAVQLANRASPNKSLVSPTSESTNASAEKSASIEAVRYDSTSTSCDNTKINHERDAELDV